MPHELSLPSAEEGFRSLGTAREAAAACTRCSLYQRATQTVFGEGPQPAQAMLVGEQPGDREDLAGRAFVGPSGHLLDAALKEVGIEREGVYLTNAIKHFKWAPAASGKRRIHKRPSASEVSACRLWLAAEISLVRPRVIICLGSTAVAGVLGTSAPICALRGRPLDVGGVRVVVTVHPASILRAPDGESRTVAFDGFLEDLRTAHACLAPAKGRSPGPAPV